MIINTQIEMFNICRAPEKMLVEAQQEPAALPLLNHNNRKRDSNTSKWDEDDFADLLGYVA